MTMLLQWRRPEPQIVTRWRGPDGSVMAQLFTQAPQALPTLIGPPGVVGPAGPQGPVGPAYDFSSAVIDGGVFT